MQPHQERAVTEQRELAEKLVTLRSFILSSELFMKVPLEEQARLKTQEFHMSMYWRVLGDRIENFPR